MQGAFLNPDRFEVSAALTRMMRFFAVNGARRLIAWDLAALVVLTTLLIVSKQAEVNAKAPNGVLWENPVVVGIFVLGVMWWWVSDAAWLKLHVGRALPRGLPWRIGADEGRVLCAWFGVGIGSMAIQLVFMVVVIPAFLLWMLATSSESEVFQTLMGGLALGVVLIASVLGAAISARFWPAGPISIAEQRLAMFDGWSRTAPFWGRLGAAALLFGLAQQGFNILPGNLEEGEFRTGLSFDLDGQDPVWAFVALYFLGHLARGVACEAAMAAKSETLASLDAAAAPPPSVEPGREPGAV
jgi:hypothetical protein